VANQNGLAGNLSSVVAIVSLSTIAISLCLWFLKLDSRTYTLESEVSRVIGLVESGVLPIAQERIADLRADHNLLLSDIEAYRTKHDKNYPPPYLLKQVESHERRLTDLEKVVRSK